MPQPLPSRASPATSLVLAALADACRPLDAYGVAKVTGQAPMDVGRMLFALHEAGTLRCLDVLGTANDLAARFEPVIRA